MISDRYIPSGLVMQRFDGIDDDLLRHEPGVSVMGETITADPVSLVFDALTKLATEVINEHTKKP